MGCPAGIGPEIILRVWEQRTIRQTQEFIVLGDVSVLHRCAREMGLAVDICEWQPGNPVSKTALPVYPLSSLTAEEVHWGCPTPKSSAAMVRYIETAVALIQSGQLAGMVTCPISKIAMRESGFTYPGHTEMLAHLTQSSRYLMMMAGSSLRVTLATIHCSLASVPLQLTTETIIETIRLTNDALRHDFGLADPRIAVAALNPHAGENGLFGNEEQTVLAPAITILQHDGLNVSGPYPPDTVFHAAVAGNFDAVVAMYHDQGLIPFKLLHFKDGVNVTCGLPIVRTSVDHGTAYDIAGKGKADCSSLQSALDMAAMISAQRRSSSTRALEH